MPKKIIFNPTTGKLDFISVEVETDPVFLDRASRTAHYTGFPNRTETTLAWDDSTTTLTVGLSGEDFNVFINGVQYNNTVPFTKALSVAQEAVSGLYWFWFTAPAGVLTLNTSTDSPGFDKCLVATVYWNTTTKKGIVSDERHWMGRDQWMHEYLHETVGARFAHGMAGTFGNTTFAIGAGEFYDEDIEHYWDNDVTSCKVLYHDGSDAWKWDVVTAPYKITGANLNFNTGTTLSTASANRFVNYFVLATADIAHPIHIVVGTSQYTTLALAQAAQVPSLGGLVSAEIKLIYKIIYKNDGTPTWQHTIDYRTASSLPTSGYVATDHGSLSGLYDLDHPASAIKVDTTNFISNLTSADDTVQKALVTIDAIGSSIDGGSFFDTFINTSNIDGGIF